MKIFNNSVLKYTFGFLAVAVLLVGPVLALARENETNDDKKEKKSENFSSSNSIFGKNDDRHGVRSLGSTLEIQINDNGRVLVRGLKVTSISGTNITGETAFGSTTLSWIVHTDSSTKFSDKGGKNMGFAGISIGDILSFAGLLDTTTNLLTVNATNVKNWSKDNSMFEKHVFSGTLQTTPASTAPTSFTFTVGSTNFTVNIPTGISILGKNWLALPLSSFVAGDKVNVYGAIQASNTSVIDASVVRNTTR